MRIRLSPILLVPALAVAGPFACNIITPALYVAEGPGKKEAEFTLPETPVGYPDHAAGSFARIEAIDLRTGVTFLDILRAGGDTLLSLNSAAIGFSRIELR